MIEHEFFDNGEKITREEWIRRHGEVPTFLPDEATMEDYKEALSDMGVDV